MSELMGDKISALNITLESFPEVIAGILKAHGAIGIKTEAFVKHFSLVIMMCVCRGVENPDITGFLTLLNNLCRTCDTAKQPRKEMYDLISTTVIRMGAHGFLTTARLADINSYLEHDGVFGHKLAQQTIMSTITAMMVTKAETEQYIYTVSDLFAMALLVAPKKDSSSRMTPDKVPELMTNIAQKRILTPDEIVSIV